MLESGDIMTDLSTSDGFDEENIIFGCAPSFNSTAALQSLRNLGPEPLVPLPRFLLHLPLQVWTDALLPHFLRVFLRKTVRIFGRVRSFVFGRISPFGRYIWEDFAGV